MLGYQAGGLTMDGVPIGALADRLGTPFFLFSAARLRANYDALRRGLAGSGLDVTIRYCAKTNHEAAILSALASWGSHVVVSHGAEAALALRCGFLPETIAYQRPLLDAAEIEAALAAGIDFFHAYRPTDLRLLADVAGRWRRPLRVSLRVQGPRSLLSPLAFLSRRLGFRPADVPAAVAQVRDAEWLRLAALNFYVGTQRGGPAAYRGPLRVAARLAARLQSRLGVTLDEVNVGGGIPSASLARVAAGWRRQGTEPEGTLPPPRRLEEFAGRLGAEFRDAARRAGLSDLSRIAVEPGRSIVGDAAVLVTTVRSLGGRWVFVDASRNYLPERLPLYARSVLAVAPASAGRRRHYHLSGNTLNTMDVLDLWRRLPPLREGDRLVLCDAGAYSLARASRYAGVTPAAYLLEAEGSVRMIRRPETLDDLVAPMLDAAPPGPSASD